MKIFIVGAGAVASVISRYLNDDKKITKITLATNDLKKAKGFINFKSEKIDFAEVDANNVADLIKNARGYDLIINASLPWFNENIMKAALAVNANYQDMASDLKDAKNPEQLKFHESFRRAKLTGLICTGLAPGISNLLASDAADKLDRVDEINFYLLEEQKTSEFIFAWSAETSLDCITSQPSFYQDGKFVLTRPFANAEEYQFPELYGKRYVYNFSNDEVATIPRFIKVNNVNFKSSGTDIDFSKALYRLGLFNKKPVNLDGHKIIPIEFFKKIAPAVPSPEMMKKLIQKGIIEDAYFTLAIEVSGKQSDQEIKIKKGMILPHLRKIPSKFFGSTYVSYPTGTAAYAFFKVIPKINRYGVFPPEALSADIRKEVLQELEKQGIIFTEQFSSY